MIEAKNPRSLVGTVVSNLMDKTIVVNVERRIQHPLYKKYIRRSKKFHAHDAENACRIGDTVKIEECRPLSKTKSWRLVKVIAEGIVEGDNA
ncbi:30S ribosomal protein S17 [Acidithiobacillus sp.]|jgi:small subunit ribosomal protein S17|uniref:30S ribosomal protein S17 n=1 Tax=Acidithiobacillus sp. TaxID=1872118 RepID=UPI0025B8AF47|nr:30S ribosomal protein S17 [Acidithiobacillus sp.]MCK9189721.1 30S ribosomal protein S17 [Acidithiobacillus sp.]MCK9360390.1 30S ribosomal protein S17 [Acidithiobacillus sp.]